MTEKLLTEREAKLEALEMALNMMNGNCGPVAVSKHLNLPRPYSSTHTPLIQHRNVAMVMNELHGIAVEHIKEIARLSKENDGSGSETASGEGSIDNRDVLKKS